MKIESDVLKRLGPVPFWRGEAKCLAELDRMYTRAKTAAMKRLDELDVSIKVERGSEG